MMNFRTFFAELAEFFQFAVKTLRRLFNNIRHPHELLKAIWSIGVKTIPIVAFSNIFIGMILALQLSESLEDFITGTSMLVGSVISASAIRELAPVLTSLLVVSRVCSSVTAELGTMRVTEQIDALETMSVDPINHLAAPRVLAGIISMPILSLIAAFLEITGGWAMMAWVVGVNSETYWMWARFPLQAGNIVEVVVKTAIIGGTILLISTYQGFITRGGADGVGKSTIRSVVTSSFAVIFLDYLIGALFMFFR